VPSSLPSAAARANPEYNLYLFVTHLVPVWLLNRFETDRRWMVDRADNR
jgi:hypothetical protein